MLSKEEINLRFSEGNVSVQEGVEILRSYIYLMKNQKIDIIPPRNEIDMILFQGFLEVIRRWSA